MATSYILFAYIFSFIRMQLIHSTSYVGSALIRRVWWYARHVFHAFDFEDDCYMYYYIVHIIFIPIHSSATDGQKGLVQYKVYNLQACTTCKNGDDDDFDLLTIFRDISLDFNRRYYYLTQ